MRLRIKSAFCFLVLILATAPGLALAATDFVMSADSVKVAYDAKGEGNTALVFVHGWSNNRTIWDGQVGHFSKNYKIVTIDLPGFGASGNNRKNWTMAAYGEDVAAVVTKLNLKQTVLVGFSMGAPVVIEAAEHLPVQVLGIVLVDNLQNIEFKAPPEMVAQVEAMFFSILDNPTLENTQMFFKNNREESLKKIIAMIKGASQIGWHETLRETFRWMNDDAAAAIRKIKSPIVSINSDNQPTNVEAFKKVSPSFQAHIIPNTGHVVMWDAPEEFNRILDQTIIRFNEKHEGESKDENQTEQHTGR